jgi:hypothetical protein
MGSEMADETAERLTTELEAVIYEREGRSRASS